MGDKCRLLPTCNHSFHAECVDTWLLRTPFCPICRTGADSRKGDDLSQTTESSSRFSDTNNNNNNDIRIDIGDGDSGGEMSHGRIEDVGNGDNNHIIEFGMNEIVQTECVEKLGELNVGTCSNNSGSKSEENFQGDEVLSVVVSSLSVSADVESKHIQSTPNRYPLSLPAPIPSLSRYVFLALLDSIFKSEYFLARCLSTGPSAIHFDCSFSWLVSCSLFVARHGFQPGVAHRDTRSGFFIGDELVEVSTTPRKPICPPHQRLRGEEYEYLRYT
uniref:RING-type E3 ubiquitin transferase n=1 Tax=Cannabis sativa TaxID=3483 RepID=A0A803Q0R4_CANSA